MSNEKVTFIYFSIFINVLNDIMSKLCLYIFKELLWLYSYGSWIYNYLCNQYLSPLKLWVRILIQQYVEETRVHRENHQSVASHWQTLSNNVVSSTPRLKAGFKLTMLVVIGTDCITTIQSQWGRPLNDHMIMATRVCLIRKTYKD